MSTRPTLSELNKRIDELTNSAARLSDTFAESTRALVRLSEACANAAMEIERTSLGPLRTADQIADALEAGELLFIRK